MDGTRARPEGLTQPITPLLLVKTVLPSGRRTSAKGIGKPGCSTPSGGSPSLLSG